MKERFILTLEANRDTRPAATRLKGLLKMALRAFGMKCIAMRETHDEAETSADGNPRDGPD